jgi:hypothetical protein
LALGGFLFPKDFKIICLSNILAYSVLGEVQQQAVRTKFNLYDKPCLSRDTEYWADDTLED